jgi:hypothetical protein
VFFVLLAALRLMPFCFLTALSDPGQLREPHRVEAEPLGLGAELDGAVDDVGGLRGCGEAGQRHAKSHCVPPW